MKKAVKRLVDEEVLARVPTDADKARVLVESAQSNIASAESIGRSDPSGAYALAYDAARKAITGHMASQGLRTAGRRSGAHKAVFNYGAAALGLDPVISESLERMRRKRNAVEYEGSYAGAQEVEAAIETAHRVVELVRRSMA